MTSASLLQLESPIVNKKASSPPNRTTAASPPATSKKAPPSKKLLLSRLDSLEFTKGKSLSDETLNMAEHDPILPKESSTDKRGCCRQCCSILDAFISALCFARRREPSSPEQAEGNPPVMVNQNHVEVLQVNGHAHAIPAMAPDAEEDPLLPIPVALLEADTHKQPPASQ